MTLSGRVALVTGASQGIGRACALRLAKSGVAVAAAARNREKLDEVVSEITAAGGQAAAFVLDVADEEQIKSVFKAAIAQFGKIDILVNNAGITRDQLVMRMKRADWDAVIQTNLTSAYLCTQQVTSSMLKQRWGRIINIASVFGQMGPGFIDTAMTEVLSGEFKEGALKMIPLGRTGTPEEVAHAVAFLASEEAGYVTGHVLNVNGGLLMG